MFTQLMFDDGPYAGEVTEIELPSLDLDETLTADGYDYHLVVEGGNVIICSYIDPSSSESTTATIPTTVT